mgnify:CR=1 FL=1
MQQPPIHIVLHSPEIPQNTGNIGRTCVALGAKLSLIQPLGFQLDEKKLLRAGLDYWQHLDVEVLPTWDALTNQFPNNTYWYFSKRATRLYTDVDYQPGDVLVFGSETQGLPTSMIHDNPEQSLYIPIQPPVRSLNLSNAVAIAAYEFHRQTTS